MSFLVELLACGVMLLVGTSIIAAFPHLGPIAIFALSAIAYSH